MLPRSPPSAFPWLLLPRKHLLPPTVPLDPPPPAPAHSLLHPPPLLQLIGMSKYMGLNHFGTDSLLRFQLRNKIRQIKQDDQMILWEGIDSLTPEELRNACAERGMRATGLKQVRGPGARGEPRGPSCPCSGWRGRLSPACCVIALRHAA
jgi:hypothetical protein